MGQPEQVHPITAAIRRRAPDGNRERFYYEVADETGCSYSAVKSWLYGTSVPDRDNLDALVRHFGREFLDELVRAQFGWCVVESEVDSNARMGRIEAHVRAIQAEFDQERNASVPMEGKVS